MTITAGLDLYRPGRYRPRRTSDAGAVSCYTVARTFALASNHRRRSFDQHPGDPLKPQAFLFPVDMPHWDEVRELSSDAAKWTWCLVLGEAKKRGWEFQSDGQLRALLGSRYRHVEAFRDLGLMDGNAVAEPRRYGAVATPSGWDGVPVRTPEQRRADAIRQQRHRANTETAMSRTVTNNVTASRASLTEQNRTEQNTPPTSSSVVTPARADVEEVCGLLSELMVANGAKAPTVTSTWRTEARLLLDRDGRPFDEVLEVIHWCQGDSFWRSNILSVPKLREKYDQLHLRMKAGPARRVGSRAESLVVDAAARMAAEAS